ncbi:MAG: N-acetyl-gamma-glutamyl-phosphate reductase [Geopsychrobacter sp.]|nr:N-acetyl-gamma-glutamyl-phosphate reductase [Geopsychrobacter sp.]
MQRVAVIGASGYTGVELLRLLAAHPQAEIVAVTSRQYEGQSISRAFPSLSGFVDRDCESLDVQTIAARADVVFTALPHKSAMAVVPGFLKAGCKVVDLSADYRLHDQHIYEDWYQTHTSPELLEEAVYGLPELYRAQIVGACLVANPGCYPTSVALGLAPLLKERLVDHRSLIIDSKSGTTGAGRGLKEGSLYCEVNEGFKAYGIASHRHTPEIEQTLSQLAGEAVVVNFTPHLLPVDRGILSTIYAQQNSDLTTAELLECFGRYYVNEPFVRVLPEGQLPNIAHVRGTNLCDIGMVADARTGRVVVVSVIDNLCKGAAGQAVQNFNLMTGLDESAGLTMAPLFP